MQTKKLFLVTLGSALLWTTTAAVASEHHKHSFTVGKKGEITLTQPAKVGNVWLLPDTYVVQHRTSASAHFVRFVELKKAQNWTSERNVTYAEPDSAGQAKCRMEPAGVPIRETLVSIAHENGGDRITQIVIQGEDVVHIF